MDMRSIFRNPSCTRLSGDGEANRPRADGMARLTRKAKPGGGNSGGEAGKYASPSGRVTATEEPAPKKTRASCLSTGRPVP